MYGIKYILNIYKITIKQTTPVIINYLPGIVARQVCYNIFC